MQKDDLFEGAQGTQLDVDMGTYPYGGKSSSSTADGALTGTPALVPQKSMPCLACPKEVSIRVRAGIPTELTDAVARDCRIEARYRRDHRTRPTLRLVPDAVVVRYATIVNGFTSLAMTKLDVLDGC